MKTASHFETEERNSRGIALITTLLILSLFTVLTLSMVIATTSDTLIDGYYRNSRGSFYAADSGANAARQYLLNQFSANVPSPFTPFSVPIPALTEQTIIHSLANTSTGFGAYQSMVGSQTKSWPGTFKVLDDTTCDTTGGVNCPTYILSPPNCTIHYTLNTGTIPTCYNAGNSSATWYQLSYPYKFTVIGQSRSNEQNTVEEQGSLILTVTIVTNSTNASSFAAWGMFIDQNPICSNGTLVGGTITGPVFTNGAWTFGTTNVGYIFTDAVGSHSPNFGYSFSSCYQSPNSTYTSGSQTIHPTFQSGVNLNQPTVPLPTDSFNQKRAVIDSEGVLGTNVSNAELNLSLKNLGKTAYPSAGASSGVYLPYTTSAGNVCPCNFNGGGIYVEGNATVTVSASGASAQVYTIVQGSTTTTVTIDTVANTTTIASGASSTTITGVPVQKDALGVFQRDATMLYVNGNITALKGGGQGVGTIQDSTALSVVSSGAVTVTGDLLYKHEPVTLVQSGSTPADTLIPANNHGQTLGIFTANGNINLANAQSNGNLQIDASIATISQSGSGGLVNTGSAINTLTIVGGRIQNTIQNINTTTRNVWFDRRYAQGGFAPPWFPSTTVTTTTTSTSPTPVVTASRTSWVNTTAQ
jgi:putative cofactor-binding repeat protein